MSTIQRPEIEAWVNPSAWDDPDEAEAVVEAILASGSRDEGTWVRIAGGTVADQQAAAERARDRVAVILDEHTARVADARRVLEDELRLRDEAIRALLREGVSAYRVAQVTGLSQSLIGRIKAAGS